MTVLVLADHDNSRLRPATLCAVTAARALGEVHVLVAGADCAAVAEAAARIDGVAKVRLADHPSLAHALAETVAPLIARLASDYSHVLAAATTTAKNGLPRAAALIDVAMVSEITKVLDAETFERPIYAGNAIATVRATGPIKVLSIRPTAFEPAAAEGGSAAVEPVDVAETPIRTRFVGREISVSERPELTGARVVIAGGRGLQSAENFAMLDQLAEQLGAAVGATRAAVDAGFVPNDYQVGQTGKIVAPELYIGIGVSGAIQHLAGMKDSKVIVAINKDEEAPIFQVADYGLVADLFTAVPELIAALDKTD